MTAGNLPDMSFEKQGGYFRVINMLSELDEPVSDLLAKLIAWTVSFTVLRSVAMRLPCQSTRKLANQLLTQYNRQTEIVYPISPLGN